ncbi:MAG TPA: hypothetical protein VLM79_33165 [Kofleriaceae bacterium]|nr:hypothetical protein [Kofleriaceae bacterium]
MKRLVHVCLASLLVAACGSDGPNFGPETTPTAAQQSGVTSTESSLVVLAAADTQGAATAGAAFGLATSSLILIAPNSSGRTGQDRPFAWPVDGVLDQALGRALGATGQRADDCAVVGPTSVKWTACSENGFTIDGTVSWGPGHVEVDVKINGSTQGFTFEYEISGNMTVSTTAIHGDMTFSGSATVNGMKFSESVHSEVDVQIADGCITSGTLTVTVSGSGTGSVNGAVQVIWTGCHAFKVRNA